MTNIRIPRAVCTVIDETLSGSHTAREMLFLSSGAPPISIGGLSHQLKWKTWLFEIGTNESVDSLSVIGGILEEFMDIPPSEFSVEYLSWTTTHANVQEELEKWGYRYFRGGQLLPNDEIPSTDQKSNNAPPGAIMPNDVSELLQTLMRGLPRAMHPLSHRRKNSQPLSFDTEYDVQDLLHALLRPWVSDIRSEEFTPSYAGTSTRMDFLLKSHSLVIEMKFVRDRAHGRKIGDELIIDVEHYRRHPDCEHLWCVVYDPNNFLQNAAGLINDLEGDRKTADGKVLVKVLIV